MATIMNQARMKVLRDRLTSAATAAISSVYPLLCGVMAKAGSWSRKRRVTGTCSWPAIAPTTRLAAYRSNG